MKELTTLNIIVLHYICISLGKECLNSNQFMDRSTSVMVNPEVSAIALEQIMLHLIVENNIRK